MSKTEPNRRDKTMPSEAEEPGQDKGLNWDAPAVLPPPERKKKAKTA